MVPRLMASREEEKRRRREEREAAEQAAAAAAARKKRLGMVTAAVLGLAAVAAIVVGALTLAGGDDKDEPKGSGSNGPAVPIPARKISDLEAAAKAAGCELKDPPNEGPTHVQEKVTYKSNPPTSGNHYPEAAADGIYDAGNEPAIENLVHTLEHGRIDFQYKPGTPRAPHRPAHDPLQREGGLPPAGLPEPDQDGLRGRRDHLGPPGRLPDVQRQGLRRPARVP